MSTVIFNVTKYLVAKDYPQLEGIDYLDTYFLIVKMTIVHLFIAIIVTQNWFLN